MITISLFLFSSAVILLQLFALLAGTKGLPLLSTLYWFDFPQFLGGAKFSLFSSSSLANYKLEVVAISALLIASIVAIAALCIIVGCFQKQRLLFSVKKGIKLLRGVLALWIFAVIFNVASILVLVFGLLSHLSKYPNVLSIQAGMSSNMMWYEGLGMASYFVFGSTALLLLQSFFIFGLWKKFQKWKMFNSRLASLSI